MTKSENSRTNVFVFDEEYPRCIVTVTYNDTTASINTSTALEGDALRAIDRVVKNSMAVGYSSRLTIEAFSHRDMLVYTLHSVCALNGDEQQDRLTIAEHIKDELSMSRAIVNKNYKGGISQ